jgi:hypothetical protein
MAKQLKTSKPTAFDDGLLNASAEAALPALDKAGNEAPLLIDAWTAHGNADALAQVAEQASGGIRKAARRALNVLKARGLRVPERTKIATLAGRPEPETLEAWMLPPDATGSILFAVTARSLTRRYRVALVYLHDNVGLQRVQVGEMSQSQLKESLSQTLAQLGPQMRTVKVPVEWARYRIARARRKHQELGIPEPLGVTSASQLLEPAASAAPEHPFDAEGFELADDDANEMAADSARLHQQPEFRSWMPSKQAIDEMLAKVGEVIVPGEEPDPEKVRQRLEEEVRAATDRYFSPQRRDELVLLMKDASLSILQRDGEEGALRVAAVMKVIQNAGLITNPPHEVGFLRGFFEKALSLLLLQGGGRLNIPVRGQPQAAPPPEEGASDDAPPAEAGE